MDIVRACLQRIKNELFPATERALFQQCLLKAFSGIIPTASGSANLAAHLPRRSRAGQSNSRTFENWLKRDTEHLH
jgi:hypothetical protein